MSDLFTSLAAQALGIAPGIRPLVAPMFASGAPLASEMPFDIMGETSWVDANPPSASHSVVKTASQEAGTEADLGRTSTQVQPWAQPIGQPQYYPTSVSSPPANPDGIPGNPPRAIDRATSPTTAPDDSPGNPFLAIDPSVSPSTLPLALDPLFPPQPSAMAPPEQPSAHPLIAHSHKPLQPQAKPRSSLPSPDIIPLGNPAVTVPLLTRAVTPLAVEARDQRPVDSLSQRSRPEMLIHDISINDVSSNDIEVKPTTHSQPFSQPSFSWFTSNQVNDQSTDDVGMTRTVSSRLFPQSFPVTTANQAIPPHQSNPVQPVFAADLPSPSIAVAGNVVPGNFVIQRQVNPTIEQMVPPPTFPVTQSRMEPLVNSPSLTSLAAQGENLNLPNDNAFHNQLADTRSISRLHKTASTQPEQLFPPTLDQLQGNQRLQDGNIQDSTIQAQAWTLDRSDATLTARSPQPASQPDQRNRQPRSTIASSQWDTHNAAIAPFTTGLQNPRFKYSSSTFGSQQTELSESIQPFTSARADQQDVSHPIRPVLAHRVGASIATNSSFINQTDMGLPSAPAMPSARFPTSESNAFPLAPDVPVRRSNGVSTPLIPSVEPLDGERFQTMNRIAEARSSSIPRSPSNPSAQSIALQTVQESRSKAVPIQPNHLSDDVNNARLTSPGSTDSVLREPVIPTTIGQRTLISSTSIHSISSQSESNGISLSHPVGERSLSRLETVANVLPEAQREREALQNAPSNGDPQTQIFATPDRPADRPTQMESLTQDARWLQRLTRDRPTAQPPSIRVSIGRIRIAASTPVPPAPRFSRPSPSLSLDQYLSRRQERQ